MPDASLVAWTTDSLTNSHQKTNKRRLCTTSATWSPGMSTGTATHGVHARSSMRVRWK